MTEKMFLIKDALVAINKLNNEALFSSTDLEVFIEKLNRCIKIESNIKSINTTLEILDKSKSDEIISMLSDLQLEYANYTNIILEFNEFIVNAAIRIDEINWKPRPHLKKLISLKKINEKILMPEHMFVLEQYKDLLITNNNYQGLYFFNYDLNIVDKIAVDPYSKEIPYVLQKVFYNESTDYLITCNNGDFLSGDYIATFFDIANKTYTHVSYENFSVDLIPPYLCLKNNQFLLTSDDNRFFIADCDLKSITEIQKAIVAKKFS